MNFTRSWKPLNLISLEHILSVFLVEDVFSKRLSHYPVQNFVDSKSVSSRQYFLFFFVYQIVNWNVCTIEWLFLRRERVKVSIENCSFSNKYSIVRNIYIYVYNTPWPSSQVVIVGWCKILASISQKVANVKRS